MLLIAIWSPQWQDRCTLHMCSSVWDVPTCLHPPLLQDTLVQATRDLTRRHQLQKDEQQSPRIYQANPFMQVSSVWKARLNVFFHQSVFWHYFSWVTFSDELTPKASPFLQCPRAELAARQFTSLGWVTNSVAAQRMGGFLRYTWSIRLWFPQRRGRGGGHCLCSGGRGWEGLCRGPSWVGLAQADSIHTISEFSGLFRQSKGGNGGSFDKVTKTRGKQGKETQNAD